MSQHKKSTNDLPPPSLEDEERILNYFKKTAAIIKRADEKQHTAVKSIDIPVVNLSPFLNPDRHSQSEKDNEVQKLFAAATEYGLFKISHHGVEEEEIKDIYQSLRDFMKLPLETRLLYAPEDPLARRGFVVPTRDYLEFEKDDSGNRLVSRSPKYSYNFGPEGEGFPPNYEVSEEHLPEFHRRFKSYYNKMEGIERVVLRVMASSLGIDEDYFTAHTKVHRGLAFATLTDTRTRAEDSELNGQDFTTLSGHTDWGTITILAAEKSGLQIIKGDGEEVEWVAPNYGPGDLLVNCGDYMTTWSNGIFKSVIHRVVMPLGETRVSIPFFGAQAQNNVGKDFIVKPIVSTNEKALEKPTNMGEFLRHRQPNVK
mmetsp:Transcript_12612/g.16315  ORF Transcript_12612/g.16315 Transcript_12612/m.16315 type:complete len:370 (+) Transcript_12612:182-1291(+)